MGQGLDLPSDDLQNFTLMKLLQLLKIRYGSLFSLFSNAKKELHCIL